MQTFLEWFCERLPDELLENRDIEGYDRPMDLHPIYPKIWYYLGLGYTQKTKGDFQEIEDPNKIK